MNRASLLLHGGRAPGVAGHADPSDALHRRLAALEGTESALVLSSGMAARTCTLLALLREGDHLVASAWLYGRTRRFLEQELPALGIEVTFIDPTETRAWRRAMQRNTRVLFLESPVNPTMRIVDLRPARMLAQELGVALVVDSTFATPFNCRPVEHGADVVLHSAAPYLGGHQDVRAGVVCGADAVIDEVRAKMAVWGQAPDPFAVWLLERSLMTLDVRLQRQNNNAMQIAQWAASHPAIRAVHYPGLPAHPDHQIAVTTMDGCGGMLAIELVGGTDAMETMLDALQLIGRSPSSGGVQSVITEPRLTSHRQLSAPERVGMGIPDGLLRLCVGLEHADDLIADLARALEA